MFHTSPTQSEKSKDQARGNSLRDTTSNKHTQNQTEDPTKHNNFDLNNVDHVPSNAKFSRFGAMLYIVEDNEAVTKMIIKGRSPTMRHVSRTHRVEIDWLFDRINLDPQIQIKCIDTENYLAGILTKANFTSDECFFVVFSPSFFRCAFFVFFSLCSSFFFFVVFFVFFFVACSSFLFCCVLFVFFFRCVFVRYTSLTTTISHDNNHRTGKHASTSWRSDGSPSCLGVSSHRWVPVKTHSTPVPTSVRRLWVAH